MPSENYLSGLCETLDWRPIEFLDLPPKLYCSLCGVVPGKTLVLPCCHALCELCYEDLLKCDRRCPLDKECFDQSCVQTSSLTQRQLETRTLLCANSKNGCSFTGGVEEMKHHLIRDCKFHAVSCKLCHAKVLRREIVKHIKENCQRGTSSRSGGYYRGDLSEAETKSYAAVETSEAKQTPTEMQLKEHHELLNRILGTLERLDSTMSNAGNEFHEQVKEQTKICGETVIGTLGRPVVDICRQLTGIEKQSNTCADRIITNEQLLKTLLEEQGGVTAGVGRIANQLQDQQLSALLEKISGLSIEVGSVRKSVTSNRKEVSQQFQSFSNSITAVHLKRLDNMDENLAAVRRDLSSLLQRSEAECKFMDEDEKGNDIKPIAKASSDEGPQVKSIEGVILSIRRSSIPNEVFWDIRDFTQFRNEGEGKMTVRYSEAFDLLGGSFKLRAETHRQGTIMYLGLFLCHYQSSKDTALKWPLSAPLTFTLVHPTHKNKNIPRSSIFFETPLRNFLRPKSVRYLQLGTTKLHKIKDIEDSGFVFQDCICVAVKVYSAE